MCNDYTFQEFEREFQIWRSAQLRKEVICFENNYEASPVERISYNLAVEYDGSGRYTPSLCTGPLSLNEHHAETYAQAHEVGGLSPSYSYRIFVIDPRDM